jgi:hypothetical protein
LSSSPTTGASRSRTAAGDLDRSITLEILVASLQNASPAV